MKPALYIVATPIGNREDISLRAIDVLKKVDIIACENTRHSLQLLSVLGIKKKLITLHQHNEKEKARLIANLIEGNKSVAYISDAGTPAISDPGAILVDYMHNSNINVLPIPGPSALIAAFSVTGFQSTHFQFYGFLPNTNGKCRKSLNIIYNSNMATILYESPHRIIKTLKHICEVFGEDQLVFIARELTKIFETSYRGKVGELIHKIHENKYNQKGEFVIVLSASNKKNENEDLKPLKEALKEVLNDISLKQSVNVISYIYNKNKKEIYKLALELKKNG